MHCLFADECALGFDPTIRVHTTPKDGASEYEIDVRDVAGLTRTYRTQGLLYESSSRRPLHRGTRVWKVVRLEHGDETGDSIVLKDSWVDNPREREGSVIARVLASASSSEARRAIEDALVDVSVYGDVYAGGQQDRTLDIPKGAKNLLHAATANSDC